MNLNLVTDDKEGMKQIRSSLGYHVFGQFIKRVGKITDLALNHVAYEQLCPTPEQKRSL